MARIHRNSFPEKVKESVHVDMRASEIWPKLLSYAFTPLNSDQTIEGFYISAIVLAWSSVSPAMPLLCAALLVA
jgi:hypothetical protein